MKVVKRMAKLDGAGSVFREQFPNSFFAVLLRSPISQGGLLVRDGPLAKLPGAMDADFASLESLHQFPRPWVAENLFHLGDVAGGHASEFGNLAPAIAPLIFRQI